MSPRFIIPPHTSAHAGGLSRNFKALQRVGGIGDLKLNDRIVQLARPQFFAEHLARLLPRAVTGERLDHPFLGGVMGLGLHLVAQVLAHHDLCGIHKVADDLFHVPPDIADLGIFRGLDLDERRLCQLRQPPRDLGLADAGRADHQDVLWIDLFPQVIAQLLAPPAIAQRHGHGALGVLLSDDEPVELGHDLAGGQVGHAGVSFCSRS
jgi:hypothetical protein